MNSDHQTTMGVAVTSLNILAHLDQLYPRIFISVYDMDKISTDLETEWARVRAMS